MYHRKLALIGFLLSVALVQSQNGVATIRGPSDQYWVGTGIADITGPAADVNLMGYADMKQTSNGIHMRVFARAFIFADGSASRNRFIFVSAEMDVMSQLVKLDVLKQLKASYGDLYSAKNVILSATHTHSAPAGYFQYFLYQITSLGFVKESHEKIVRGIVGAIKKAHANLTPAYLYLTSGKLANTQINRSPTSYSKNPSAERAFYSSDVDTTMQLLRINNALNGNAIGMINWYPVHGVSMNKTNRLISSDNKGYAAQMFERAMEPQSLAGRTRFVGAFVQGAVGDVSPNTAGPRCVDSGFPCDLDSSSCNGRCDKCTASGPGRDMFESTKIIGENQLRKALELFNAGTDNGLRGGIRFVHKYVDMANVTVDLGNGKTGKTCIPAMGYAFAAGTTDGPGITPFTQHTLTGSLIWDGIRDVLQPPTQEMINCHYPKPILLTTGLLKYPYQWQGSITDIHLAKIGQLVIVPVPGEFTTMSGRRLIAAVSKVFADAGQRVEIVITGLSNVYTHYITTPEEYANQRYEGASTVFGPNTLLAYIQLYKELARSLISGTFIQEGPQPPYFKEKLWSVLPPVAFDRAGLSRNFGDIVSEPKASYRCGEVVNVEFVGANPRNSLETDLDSFMRVEKIMFSETKTVLVTSTENGNKPGLVESICQMIDSWFSLQLGFCKKEKTQTAAETTAKIVVEDKWQTVFTDAEWETRLYFEKTLLGTSTVKMQWEIPIDMAEGTYRICYNGHSKSLISGTIDGFSGCSPKFFVTR